jgi:5,5'-dehydrodivanillate O-demethylase
MENTAENRRLTQVGKGTPMGELLRRYWWPIAVNSELAASPTKAVTLLGESLVLFKDRQDRYGLIAARCAHRSFDMGVFAIPEDDGLRCPYHGWVYAHDGRCLETPPEPRTSTFKDRIRIDGYPVQELGGLLFAYLGPQPAPLLPRWDLFAMENVFRTVGQVVVPCNWLQCMENSVDTVHTEWLHGWMFEEVLRRKGQPIPPQVKSFERHHEQIDFDLSDYGIIKKRLVAGQSEAAEDWAVGHPLVFPLMVRLGGSHSFRYEFQIRVPMDDERTWHLSYQVFDPGPDVKAPVQESVPAYETPITDGEGQYRFDYVLSHDLVAWWSQGAVAPRNLEHLAESDRGVILFRKLLREQMEIVERGGEPMNVFRDPAQNVYLRLASENQAAGGERMNAIIDDLRNGPTGALSPALEQVEALYAKMRSTRDAAPAAGD